MQVKLIIRKNDRLCIANDCVMANTILLRMKGLLGRAKMNADQAIWILPCNSIHTFFMKFPIDVLFLDKNNRVVSLIENIKPWRLSKIIFSAYSVVELKAGRIGALNIKLNDELEFKNEISIHS